MTNRRRFLAGAAAGAGVIGVLPFAAHAAGTPADSFATDSGAVTVQPVVHASFVLQTPAGVIHVDPVGGAARYAELPAPDLILITHEHGDHFDPATLAALAGARTRLLTNPAVHDMLPADLKAKAGAIANGEREEIMGIGIEAIPAHNLTEGRMNFHPEGRDNGYVLNVDGLRIYISGDTEGVPEMRALRGIDVAFVCMNLPFTMAAEQAADAVAEFSPGVVYPYHYRGRDGGTQDPAHFAELLAEAGVRVEVRTPGWYDEMPG